MSTVERTALVEDTAREALNIINKSSRLAYEFLVKRLSASTLEFVLKVRESLDDLVIGPSIASLLKQNHPDDLIEECLMFMRFMIPTRMGYSHYIIQGLHEYPQIPQGVARETMTPAQHQQCVALLLVTQALEYDYMHMPPLGQTTYGAPYIRDKRLVDLVIKNAGNVQAILDVIRQRQIADPEAIEEFLPIPPVLREGVL